MPREMESFPPIGGPDPSSSWMGSIRRKCPITIEPILFFVFFATAVSDGYSLNVLLARTCTVIYQLPDSVCNDINEDTEGIIQPYTTKITMFKSLVEAFISGGLSMFIGPWSDSNGRKPFLVLPVAGYTLYYIGWFLLINLPTLHPLWFLVPSVFCTLPGGLVSFFTCVFCYITDVTSMENRAFRMSIVTSTISAGIVGGYLTSFAVYKYYYADSGMMLMGLAIASSFIALLYAVIILPESLDLRQTERSSFFSLKSVSEMFKSVFQPRPRKGRSRLLLAISVVGITIVILQGEIAYKYYALRKTFLWTLEHYNIYSAIVCAISVFAAALGTYISTSVLKIHELYVALFAVLMTTLSGILSALSRTSVEYYIFSVVGCLGSLVNPMMKTQITRNLSKNDLGKVYAFISTLEAFSPLLASPLYRTVYNHALDHQPLAVFFLSAGFWVVCAVIISTILLIQAFFTRNYEELIVNADSEEGIAQPIGEPISNDEFR